MEHGEFIITGQRRHLLDGEPIRRGIDQPAARHHRGRLGEPCGIPERANLSARLIARTGAAIKSLIAWRIQKKGMFHSSTVLSIDALRIAWPRDKPSTIFSSLTRNRSAQEAAILSDD